MPLTPAQARTNILTRYTNAVKRRDPDMHTAYLSGYLTYPPASALTEDDITGLHPDVMPLDELEAWIRIRGAEDPSHVAELLEQYAGWTEFELDEEYDRFCGPTA